MPWASTAGDTSFQLVRCIQCFEEPRCSKLLLLCLSLHGFCEETSWSRLATHDSDPVNATDIWPMGVPDGAAHLAFDEAMLSPSQL